MSDQISTLLASKSHSRRKFLAGLGLTAGTAAMIGCGSDSKTTSTTPTPTPSTTITDADILNFALNLEYLEAEFYLLAVTGSGLGAADIGANPGATTGGGQVAFATPAIKAYAMEIANDEQAHVRFLRSAITKAGGTPVDKPAIDLVNSFNGAASAAGIGTSFNPFNDENSFLVGAFVFEDVGVTAYNGAVTLISDKTILGATAAIHATEAYHAAEIRTLLVYNSDPSFLAAAVKISALRGAASAASGAASGMAEVAPSSSAIVPADSNSLAFPRTTDQVLDIVYLNATGSAASKGGFYPNGMNGKITASAK
jgi:hypothetical protein